MVKKLIKLFSVLILIALVIAGIFFYSIYVSVDRVNISYQNITSKKIPKELNDIKIAFISDVKYGSYMKKERLTKMIESLNDIGADVVIFGGDMFDTTALESTTSDGTNVEGVHADSLAQSELTEIFKGIKAPLGKFAVLGDQDVVSEETKNLVNTILYDSDFEIITNNSVRLRNKSNNSISLIGLDALIGGTPDYATAFSKINKDEFNMLVTHCPDIVEKSDLNTNYLDIAMAGHSLGGQIYLPLFGPIQNVEGATTYNHGTYTINSMKLYVSNGLGTIHTDMRLFAPPQILVFRLQHK